MPAMCTAGWTARGHLEGPTNASPAAPRRRPRVNNSTPTPGEEKQACVVPHWPRTPAPAATAAATHNKQWRREHNTSHRATPLTHCLSSLHLSPPLTAAASVTIAAGDGATTTNRTTTVTATITSTTTTTAALAAV